MAASEEERKKLGMQIKNFANGLTRNESAQASTEKDTGKGGPSSSSSLDNVI